jgi:F0F1-type ATP synthase membrane subunit b/b'
MNNDDNALGHLLEIESEAASLVNDAQAEADRRIAEGEKRNRAAYEERYRAEAEKLEGEFQKDKEKVKNQYQKELEAYREKISALAVDQDRFSAFMNGLFAGEF